MKYLYLIIIIVCISAQDVCKKAYGKKVGDGGIYIFGTLNSVAALLFFLVTAGKFDFNISVLPYAAGFAASYGIGTVASIAAISHGPLSLTALIVSYSLMMPTVYGLAFLQDPISIGLIPGLILLVISLVLINKKSDDAPITLKWVFYVTLSFLGNGMCSIVQKMQQVSFDGSYKNEFMIMALALVIVFTLIMAVINERKDSKKYVGAGLGFGVLCGAANGIVNLFVMILSNLMPASLMFPLISAGGMIITYIISKFFYKEILSKPQLIGFLLGTASVVLLNV